MFLKLGPRKHEFPVAALIPNLLTTLALCSGLAAIHFASKPDFDKALAAVTLAAIFDALDGRAARLLRVTSGFGAILDSLSDFLSFGVAPAFMLHQWLLAGTEDRLTGRWGVLALAAFMTYALCAALRLARFTADSPGKGGVKADRTSPDRSPAPHEKPSPFFTGMPSPAAAGIVLIPMMLATSDIVAWRAPAWGVVGFAFLIGVLMVTRIPMFSLKALRVGRRAVAPMLIAVAILAAGMLYDPWLTLTIICGTYVLSIPLTAMRWWRHRSSSSHAPGPT